MNVCRRILGESNKAVDMLKDAVSVYSWAKRHKTRLPEKEHILLQDPYLASLYASDVIKGPWPEAEDVIATDSTGAYNYAVWALKAPWPKGEAAIAKKPIMSLYYATNIKGRRFKEGEREIAKHGGDTRSEYLKAFPEAEEEWILNGWMDWMDE